MDGTTSFDQDGTWLAVGDQGDLWMVTHVATNPTFTRIDNLVLQTDALLAQAAASPLTLANLQVPVPPPVLPQGPPDFVPPGMFPGQGIKPLPPANIPPPKLPGNPQGNPTDFGGLFGGLGVARAIPGVANLGGGITVVQVLDKETGKVVGYQFTIPLNKNADIIITTPLFPVVGADAWDVRIDTHLAR